MTTWLPLESNPDVLNQYIHKLGVSDEWSLTDVVGLDPDMLEWIPQPVRAIILLFPCSKAYESHRTEEDIKLKQNPQQHPEDLFYLKQVIHNACGTIALVHSIANNKDIPLNDGVLKKYIDAASNLDPEQRGIVLENNQAFTETHQELAQQGQTTVNPDEEVNHHFVALVNKNGTLYELDGRKSFPIKHGATSEATFLQDAAALCKNFMARDPDEVRFTVLALTRTQN